MTASKRVIVEYGLRRQQIVLSERFLPLRRFLQLLLHQFNIAIEENVDYLIQIYDSIINEFYTLDDEHHVFNVTEDVDDLHRFRLIRRSKKDQWMENLHGTIGKLDHATENIRHIQSCSPQSDEWGRSPLVPGLIDGLNHSCDILNQAISTRGLKANLDGSQPIGDIDDEQIDSVSCYQSVVDRRERSPVSIPILTQSNKPKYLIPCKYAIRSQCYYGDRCLYLHDEPSLRSAREWEKRL